MSWLSHLAFWRSPEAPSTAKEDSPSTLPESSLSTAPRSPLKVPETTADSRSMSPYSRVKNWLSESPPEVASTPQVSKTTKRKQSFDGDWISISAKKPKKCHTVGNDEDTDIFELEGSTLVTAASPPTLHKINGHPNLWEHPVDANDDTIVTETAYDKPTARAFAAERQHREAGAASLASSGWSEADIALFHHLSMRGFEPLLPHHWEKDFQVLPSALFTSDTEKALVKALGKKKGAKFRATKALETLLELGPKVRDKVISDKPPEGYMKRATEAYVKWGMADLGLRRKTWTSAIAIQIGDKNTDPKDLQDGITSKLENLRSLWQGENSDGPRDDIPQVYGVIISHTIVAFVSYISSTTNDVESNEEVRNKKLRTIAMFDFGNSDYDVWNSFAIAILAVHCRNIVAKTLEGRKLMDRGVESSESKETEPDVDV